MKGKDVVTPHIYEYTFAEMFIDDNYVTFRT